MKHKLAQVMFERNASKRLKGKVQMDDAYIGGAASWPARTRRGRQDAVRRGCGHNRRRQAGSDHPAARQGVQQLSRSANSPARRSVPAPWSCPTDWRCFTAVTEAGCTHEGDQDRQRRARPPRRRHSNGSTRRSAISRRRWWEPTAPCGQNTCRAISPNSNIGSTADTISKR